MGSPVHDAAHSEAVVETVPDIASVTPETEDTTSDVEPAETPEVGTSESVPE